MEKLKALLARMSLTTPRTADIGLLTVRLWFGLSMAFAHGLKKAEVPFLRRIARQDFPFKAGIDVTDVRQVKGLEFDYVVLLEVSNASYAEDDEARHLLHIAATRAAHQLWVTTPGRVSPLLPASLVG